MLCCPDSGTPPGDYVHRDTAAWLIAHNAAKCLCDGTVCSGVGDGQYCVPYEGRLGFVLEYRNEINRFERIQITAKIAKSLYPVVIGLNTIRAHSLARKCSFFCEIGNVRRDSKRPDPQKRGTDQPPSSHNNSLMAIANKQRFLYRKEDVPTPEPDEDYISL